MMLASGATDGTVFFFELEPDNMQTYIPLCMIQLEAKVTDMCWDSLAKKLLVGLDNGRVYIIDRPKKA
jgi:WD40 repeat protein